MLNRSPEVAGVELEYASVDVELLGVAVAADFDADGEVIVVIATEFISELVLARRHCRVANMLCFTLSVLGRLSMSGGLLLTSE